MNHKPGCVPQQPCHDWKRCDHCAALRQARVAELAQRRCKSQNPTYAVITGLNPETIVAARRFRAGSGGVWTIEIGERMAGLHANLILDSDAQVDAQSIAAALNIRNSAVWASQIPARDIRNVAAYITKRSGAPKWHDYDGRLMGTWGTWRGAGQVAREQRLAPIVQGAAQQEQLRALGVLNTLQASSLANELNSASEPPKSHEDYRKIAARHLAAIRQIVDK